MITRRAFLSALAALPFVGKWMPKEPPQLWNPGDSNWQMVVLNTKTLRVGDVFSIDSTYIINPDPQRLTFAEWDRKHNG